MDVDCQFKHEKVEAVTIYITFVRSASQLTDNSMKTVSRNQIQTV